MKPCKKSARPLIERLETRELLSPYLFTDIADTRMDSPFTAFAPTGPSISPTGSVAFEAELQSGRGIFLGNGTDPMTTIDHYDGPFGSFGPAPSVNAAGTAAYWARPPHFQGSDIIASDGTTISFSVFTVSGGFSTAPSINGAGTVAYSGNTTGIPFLATSSRGTVYQATGAFNDFADPAINGTETLAFSATLQGGQASGIFAGDGSAPTPCGIATTGFPFDGFGTYPSLNDAGTVAFSASLTQGGSGVFTGVCQGTTYQAIALSGRSYSAFGAAPSINNLGEVAFLATRPAGGGPGIFTGPDAAADKVIATGDPLLDSSVTDLGFFRQGLNDAGEVTFWASLADGASGIFRADPGRPSHPDPNPRQPAQPAQLNVDLGSALNAPATSAAPIAFNDMVEFQRMQEAGANPAHRLTSLAPANGAWKGWPGGEAPGTEDRSAALVVFQRQLSPSVSEADPLDTLNLSMAPLP
jgi:hypothetical protein